MQQQNLTHVRGDRFDKTVTLSVVTASQISEAWFTVRASEPAGTVVGDIDAVQQVTITSGAITKPTDTTLRVLIENFAQSFTGKRFFFDLQIRTTGGAIYTLTRGDLNLIADITRST